MEDTMLSDNSSFFVQMQKQLQDELNNYRQNSTSFVLYLKTIDKIDLWLNSGRNNENS